jgi:hypothetical protein
MEKVIPTAPPATLVRKIVRPGSEACRMARAARFAAALAIRRKQYAVFYK